MSSYFGTIGFNQDKARLFGLLDRIATALEQIAALEKTAAEEWDGGDDPHGLPAYEYTGEETT